MATKKVSTIHSIPLFANKGLNVYLSLRMSCSLLPSFLINFSTAYIHNWKGIHRYCYIPNRHRRIFGSLTEEIN